MTFATFIAKNALRNKRRALLTIIMVAHDPKAAFYGTRGLHLEKSELAHDSRDK